MYGTTYIRLRDRHRPAEPEQGWKVKGPKLERCATCGTPWPCEVGQAWKIIDMLLVWPLRPS